MIDQKLDPPDPHWTSDDEDALADLADEVGDIAEELRQWSEDLERQARALQAAIRRVAGPASHYEPESKE